MLSTVSGVRGTVGEVGCFVFETANFWSADLFDLEVRQTSLTFRFHGNVSFRCSDWLFHKCLTNHASRGLNPQNPNRFHSQTRPKSLKRRERELLIGKHLFKKQFKSLLHWPSRLVHHKMVKTRSRPLTSAFYNKSKVRDDRHSTTFSWILFYQPPFFIPSESQQLVYVLAC